MVENSPAGDGRSWLAVRVEPSGDRQNLIDAIFAAGSLGVHEDGNAIVTHFPPGTDSRAIEQALHRIDADATVVCSLAPQTDWSQWRASVRAHRLGLITITPPWLAGENGDTIEVIIDPAMAFGTGEHPTTRGVVRLMQKLPQLPDFVADLGAGSAVLAICAAKLGAKRVAAIELDHDAIENAEHNVAANDEAHSVQVIEGDAGMLLPLIAPVGLVLANIISSILLHILPILRDAIPAGGHAILSGILLEERNTMVDAIKGAGWKIVAEDNEEAWWSVLIERQQ